MIMQFAELHVCNDERLFFWVFQYAFLPQRQHAVNVDEILNHKVDNAVILLFAIAYGR